MAKTRNLKPDDEAERPIKRKAPDIQKCFLCQKGQEESVLHEVSTFDADKK